MSNKKKIKRANLPQVKEALKQLELSVPQAMALLQEMKIINLQLKVANNALLQEINKTFQEFGERLGTLEEKVLGSTQGEPICLGGSSVDAMSLPTEQAKKDAELLRRIQEADKKEDVVPAKSVPLGGLVGEPSEDDIAKPTSLKSIPTSMFPKA